MLQALDLGGFRLALILDAHGQNNGDRVFSPATREEWSPGLCPDPEGNLPTVVRALLISEGDRHTLVDTGYGDQERADRPERIIRNLSKLGLQPGDISRVIITHAHGDHIMGNTVERSGRWLPAYPSAEYVIQEKEIAAMREQGHAVWRTRFQPLADHGLLRTIDGWTELSDALVCWPSPGHTAGHQSVLIRTTTPQVLAIGDLGILAKNFENPQWGPSWAWSWDVDAESRHRVCEWAVENGTILFVGHDPQHPWITLERAEEGYRFTDAE